MPNPVTRKWRDVLLRLLLSINESEGTDDGYLTVLARLTECHKMRHEVEIFLVVEARRQGATWQAIGDALEIPRQLAWRRYKDLEESSPDGIGG
jgi:hypothetical protein